MPPLDGHDPVQSMPSGAANGNNNIDVNSRIFFKTVLGNIQIFLSDPKLLCILVVIRIENSIILAARIHLNISQFCLDEDARVVFVCLKHACKCTYFQESVSINCRNNYWRFFRRMGRLHMIRGRTNPAVLLCPSGSLPVNQCSSF